MVDRQDIDALLIGSLYGELSSADEARLQAHLEAHPADRSLLERLGRARQAVRESRLLQVQLDPPQAISAVLLQEAARRAPRAAPAEEAREGWFARLRRSLLLHPAMAAAAMLVLVVGVAGTVYMRQGDHFAAPELQREQAARSAGPGAPAAAAGSGAPMPQEEPAPAPGAAAAPEPAAALEATAAQTPAPSKTAKDRGGAPPPSADPAREAYRAQLADERPEAGAGRGSGAAVAGNQLDEKADRAKQKAEARRDDAPRGLEVSTPQAAPKDMGDMERAAPRPAPKPAVTVDSASAAKAGTGYAVAPESAASAGARAPAAPPPPPAGAVAPGAVAQDRARVVTKGAYGGDAPRGEAEDKIGAPEADAAWARAQLARLEAQLREPEPDCRLAASTAAAIAARAPAFYRAEVETRRDLQRCIAYVNDAREQAERQRLRAAPRSEAEPRKQAAPPARPAKPATKAPPSSREK